MYSKQWNYAIRKYVRKEGEEGIKLQVQTQNQLAVEHQRAHLMQYCGEIAHKLMCQIVIFQLVLRVKVMHKNQNKMKLDLIKY